MSVENMHGWRKWFGIILLVFLVVSFLFFGLSYYMQSMFAGGKNIASVAGQPITHNQFQRALQIQQQNTPQSDPNALPFLKQKLLAGMIMQRVMSFEAKNAGFTVSDAVLQKEIQTAHMFQVSGAFSRTRFEQIAEQNGMTAAQLLQKYRQSMAVYQMQSAIMAGSFIVPALVQQYYKTLFQKRDVAYLSIDPKNFVKQMHPSASTIADYFHSNRQNYIEPASVKLQYVVLDPAVISKKISVSDADAREYYAGNKSSLLSPQRWRVRKVIVTGANAPLRAQSLLKRFSGQAVAWSALNAQKDVNVTELWVNSTSADAQSMAALSQLKKDQFSKVFNVGRSYIILQLLQSQPPAEQAYSAVKSRIENTLRSQQVAKKMAQLNETLSNLAYSNTNTLQPIAKQLGLKLQTSVKITKNDAQGLFANKSLLDAAFSDSVFAHANNSAPITLSDGRIVILRALQAVAKKPLSLAAVKSKVTSSLQQQMAQQRAMQLQRDITADLRAGKGMQLLAKKYHLAFKQINGLNSEMQHVDPNLLDTAFSISGIGSSNIASMQLINGDYGVLQIMKISSPDMTNIPETKLRQVTTMLTEMKTERDLRLFTKSAQIKAKVKLYPGVG
jgi:peptidyl-prolyl cis-trans isomerase D